MNGFSSIRPGKNADIQPQKNFAWVECLWSSTEKVNPFWRECIRLQPTLLTDCYTRCEHYSELSRGHLFQHLDNSYDIDYVDAYFHEDSEELERIEQAAFSLGYGPLVDCTTVTNFSAQRVCCRGFSFLSE